MSPFTLYLWYCTDSKADFRLVIADFVTRVFEKPPMIKTGVLDFPVPDEAVDGIEGNGPPTEMTPPSSSTIEADAASAAMPP